jgi:hypothetical protein
LVVDQLALPNTKIVTYIPEIHNRGKIAADGVQAEITTEFALRLLDGNPYSIP